MEPAEYQILYAEEERYWWYRGLRSLVEEEIRRLYGLRPHSPAPIESARPLRALDAGCGTGGMTRRLRASGFRVTGIDQSRAALSLAAKRGGFPLARSSVVSLPFRSESFDLILSLDVLYHRAVSSDLEALREMRRCLVPGGSAILNLPAYGWLRSSHDEAVHTARRYTRSDLRPLLESAGLQVRRISYWNTILFPGLALVRLLRRPRGRVRAGTAGHEHRVSHSTADLGGHAAGTPGHEHLVRRDPAAPSGDVRPLPPALNQFLERTLALERAWLRHQDLPFGLSLLAVVTRPADRS